MGEDTACNPLHMVEAYHAQRLYLSAGDGNARDLVAFAANVGANLTEAVVRATTDRFDHALTAAGIDHACYPMRGRSHDWSNWNENFAHDLPDILAAL